MQHISESSCPERVQRRMERQILAAGNHPAMQHPFKYSFDVSKQLAVAAVALLLAFITWQAYIQPPHAVAPTNGVASHFSLDR